MADLMSGSRLAMQTTFPAIQPCQLSVSTTPVSTQRIHALLFCIHSRMADATLLLHMRDMSQAVLLYKVQNSNGGVLLGVGLGVGIAAYAVILHSIPD